MECTINRYIVNSSHNFWRLLIISMWCTHIIDSPHPLQQRYDRLFVVIHEQKVNHTIWQTGEPVDENRMLGLKNARKKSR